MRGGQVSVEYLMVLGIALLILLPGAYLFYAFSQGSNDRITGGQIVRAGTDIINTVEMVYGIGGNSWDTVNINFPDKVTDVYILENQELVIEFETAAGLSRAVFFSNINMTTPYPGGNITTTFHSGLTKLKISSLGSNVQIVETYQ